MCVYLYIVFVTIFYSIYGVTGRIMKCMHFLVVYEYIVSLQLHVSRITVLFFSLILFLELSQQSELHKQIFLITVSLFYYLYNCQLKIFISVYKYFICIYFEINLMNNQTSYCLSFKRRPRLLKKNKFENGFILFFQPLKLF